MSRAETHRADQLGVLDEMAAPAHARDAREADRLGIADDVAHSDADPEFLRRMEAAVEIEESASTGEIPGSEALLARNSARFHQSEGRGSLDEYGKDTVAGMTDADRDRETAAEEMDSKLAHPVQDDDIISATRFIDGQTPGGM